MNIAINTNSLKEHTLDEAIQIIHSIGCNFIELSTDGKKHGYGYLENPQKFKEDIVKDEIIAISGGWCDFAEGDCSALGGQIELCRRLGVDKLRLFVTNPHKDYAYDNVYPVVVSNIRAYSKKYPDIMMLFENHDGIMASGEKTLKLLEDIDQTNVGTVYDPTNYYVSGSDPVLALDSIGKYVKHVHAKNYFNGEFSSVDKGVVDWETIVKKLHKLNYKGFLSIEHEGGGDPASGLKGSYEYLKKIIM